MSYSRIDKMIVAKRGLASLALAQAARERDFHIILPARSGADVALMAKAAVALALRTFRGGIFVTVDSHTDHAGHKALFEELAHEAATYGSPERLHLGRIPMAGGLVLGIGVQADGIVTADAAGWNCAVNRLLAPSPAAGPAAAIAVAMAFAKIFNFAVLGQDAALREAWTFSLETQLANASVGPCMPVNLGRVALLGCGAIGAATIFVIKCSGWVADIDLIDYDLYDRPNEETTLLLGLPEVLRNRYKAAALAELGAAPTLKLNPRVQKIEDASDPLLLEARDAFLVAVDNPDVRRILDGVNAHGVFNAGVGGTSADAGHVLWSRHLKGDKALSALYPPVEDGGGHDTGPIPSEIQDECSRVVYENASFAAPFMALAAGALLASGCAHHAAARVQDSPYLKLDLFGFQSKFRRGGGR